MSPLPYQLAVDGFAANAFRVRSLVGKEALSEAYSFDVVVTCEAGGDPVERAALGQRAALVFDVGDAPRAFYGIISSARLAEAHGPDGAVQYELRLVPRLWLLKRKQRTRIFQRMRVPDIVAAVLLEAGIPTRWQLTRPYPEREYTTQYEESDYRFVKRLLAEAGIFFYFPEGPPLDDLSMASSALAGDGLVPGDTVIGADDASCYPTLRGDDGAGLLTATATAMASGLAGAGSSEGLGAAGALAGGIAAAIEGASVPTLHFRTAGEGAMTKSDRVTRFALESSVRSNAAVYREYDPQRPMALLESRAVSSQPFPPSKLEAAAMAMATAANAAGVADGALPTPTANEVVGAVSAAANKAAGALTQTALLEVYEHHSPFLFPKWAFSADEAPRILRQKRRRASVARGESSSSDLSPGHRFALEDHPAAHLDGTYAVVSVVHKGQTRAEGGEAFTIYSNTFECVPAEMTYVPARSKRKAVQVALTATVVGPAGEDIHVDELGQIRVQFHWDREGKRDENASCWIRCMQAWGGAAWGHQFIPRVGMEVVVVFEGGDPDKPIVLGSLYNGTHPLPFLLPQDKTRSGIRTQSSPGGVGHNELSFQDAAGREQIFLQAHRDLDEVVGKNHTLSVVADEKIVISGQRSDTVEKDLTSTVKGDRKSQTEGNRIEVVQGNADDRVTGALVSRIEGTERRIVAGDANLAYQSDVTTKVLGSSTTVVGTQDKKRAWVTHAEGVASLSGLDKLELSSEKELVITVGKSSIRITPDKIEIAAATITAKGAGAGLSASDDGLALSSKGEAQLVVKDKIVLKTDDASISMAKEVKVDGKQILLNSPDKAKDPPPKDPEPPTRIALTDLDKKPLAEQRFLIVLDDKSQISGRTDADGKAELELAMGGKITFPDLTFPDDMTGKGPLLPYVVKQGDYLTKLAFTYGFDEETVWNDPKNKPVKDVRPSGNLLHPGDILYFAKPHREGRDLRKGTDNAYEAKVPTTTLELAFDDADGPFANEPYVIEGMGAKVEGTSGGDGKVKLEVPLHIREARIVFTKKRMAFPVGVGDMDPIDEPMGVRKRLEHLGFRRPSSEAGSESEAEAQDQAALSAFQKAKGLEPTGKVDDATKAELEKAHGS